MDDRVLVWDSQRGALTPCPGGAPPPDVADSWVVEEGTARGVDLHLARFADACRTQCGVDVETTRRMLSVALATIPPDGRWFPRVECARGGSGSELRLRLRGAPAPARRSVTVWVGDGPDPRTLPRVKGPDLALLEAVRTRAHQHGADEALLRDQGGHALEGAFSGLLWWRDGALCLPDEQLPVLRSVTASLLVGLALARGHPVHRERCRVDQLAGLEVWMVSALHGIRPVTGWCGTSVEPGPCDRAASWQARLDTLRRPLEQFAARHVTIHGPDRSH